MKKLNRQESIASIIRRLRKESKYHHQLPSVADALEFRRDCYGLTASQFADILGLQNSHYSEIVHGKRDLPLSAARRAAAIGVPVLILLNNPKEKA